MNDFEKRCLFAVIQHCDTQKSHADDECYLSRCISQFPYFAIIRLVMFSCPALNSGVGLAQIFFPWVLVFSSV